MNRQRGIKDTSSRFRGTSFCKADGRWHAGVRINRKLVYLGTHATELEAAALA